MHACQAEDIVSKMTLNISNSRILQTDKGKSAGLCIVLLLWLSYPIVVLLCYS